MLMSCKFGRKEENQEGGMFSYFWIKVRKQTRGLRKVVDSKFGQWGHIHGDKWVQCKRNLPKNAFNSSKVQISKETSSRRKEKAIKV